MYEGLVAMKQRLDQLHPILWRMSFIFLFWWFGFLNCAVDVNCLLTCPDDAAYNWTVSIYNQKELDHFMNQFEAATSIPPTDDSNTSRCIQLSIMGGFRYTLDIVKMMQIKLGSAGGLIVVGMNGSVEIDCVASAFRDIEELKKIVKPISSVSLVMFDGLTFVNCPVPILIEEVSLIVVQNCDFM